MLPSKTLRKMGLYRRVYATLDQQSRLSLVMDVLLFLWHGKTVCRDDEYSVTEIDNQFAKYFDVLTGRWLVVVSSEVDNLWERIVKSTITGTLGPLRPIVLITSPRQRWTGFGDGVKERIGYILQT